ncbi:MAG: hypothetical protein KGI60_03715 [Patescibacteria group bacterium]|nr:hypothetical protein [Patescibacteria group bacterium]
MKKYLTTAGTLLLPLAAFAQQIPTVTGAPVTNVQSINDVTRIIVSLVNWITGLFFVAAILSLFYAAYLYLGAEGTEERVAKAKEQLIYSIVAITVALLAGSIRYIVQSILQL